MCGPNLGKYGLLEKMDQSNFNMQNHCKLKAAYQYTYLPFIWLQSSNNSGEFMTLLLTSTWVC